MSTPSQPSQKFVRCPKCSERLGVRAEDAGRRARCTKCRHVFVIGGATPNAGTPTSETSAEAAAVAAPVAVPPTPAPPLEPAAPVWVSFSCSLCDTRMSERVSQVGKTVACPDCGRKNVVPPPPKPKKANVPKAMGGDQLGLWSADTKTWEKGFVTGETLHPVICRVCQTRMYANDEQVGRELKCPDCGALTVAVRSAPKKAPQLAPPPGEEIELDPDSAPAPRPAAQPLVTTLSAHTQAAAALAIGGSGRKLGAPLKKEEVVHEERPVCPRVPLVQGVWSMLLTEEIFARWVMMSILFAGAGWCFVSSVGTPIAGPAAMIGIFLMLGAVLLLVMWLTFAAPTYLAIVNESADGHRRLQEPPGWSPFEWIGEVGFFVVAVAIAAMPGMIASQIPSLPNGLAGAIGFFSTIALFPVALLGALVENSPFGVVSPKLLGTLFRRPGHWLLFYIETGLIAAAVAAAGMGLEMAAPIAAMVVMPPLIMAASLLYMRLLGRLGWWLSDALAEPEGDDEEVDHAAAAHPNLAASRAQDLAERKADVEAIARGKRAATGAKSATLDQREPGKDRHPLKRTGMPAEFGGRPRLPGVSTPSRFNPWRST